MNVSQLNEMMERSLKEPLPEIVAFCDPWYSPYYTLMARLAQTAERVTPTCVELGVDQGRGSYSFLYGGARVFAVDNDSSKTCDRIAQHPYFTLHHGDSAPCPFPGLKKEVEVLLIDTEHSWDQAAKEFEAYKPYLVDGAVVLFDDTHAKEDDVLRYVNSLPYDKIHNDDLHPTCGFSAIIYRENV